VTWTLRVAASAERALARLPEKAATAIVEFITGPLIEEPLRVGKPLRGPLDGYLSARRGPYRVIYRVDRTQGVVDVVRVDHRSQVYRRL
jgi:mRNA-degrading endonuclease RelE of RelBE toxin-antitoxin system